MRKIYDFVDKYKDAIDFLILLFAIAMTTLILLALFGCVTAQNPTSVITPPGLAVSKSITRPKLTVFVAAPPSLTNIALTCDIGSGSYNGLNIYSGGEPWNLMLLASFPTNVCPVAVPLNWPSLLEVRTFINWPAPYVVNCLTNDDGSTSCVTNTFYEGTNVSDFLYVPPGCSNQWVFINSDGTTTLAGWGLQDVTYQMRSGQLQAMVPVGSLVGTNGPWLHTAAGEGPFWSTQAVGP